MRLITRLMTIAAVYVLSLLAILAITIIRLFYKKTSQKMAAAYLTFLNNLEYKLITNQII